MGKALTDWNELAERCEKVISTRSGYMQTTEHDIDLEIDIIREIRKIKHVPFRNITCSRDGISEIIERVLPGWAYKMGTCSVSDDAWLCPDLNDPVHGQRLMQQFGPVEKGSIWDEGFDIDRRPSGNMALAMCEAFCRAMAAVAAKDAAREGK